MNAGLELLTPLLERHGFALARDEVGKGSGGEYASASFARDDRVLHLWLRLESLSVRYEIGGRELDHATYMRELLGPGGGNRFPSFADDADAAFAALRHDLEAYAGDFLSGPGDEFRACCAAAEEAKGLTGPQRLARIERRLRGR